MVSPLASETIQANCAACHSDLAGFVHGVQEKITGRTVAIGENLKALTDRLADAVASGKYTDEQLATFETVKDVVDFLESLK